MGVPIPYQSSVDEITRSRTSYQITTDLYFQNARCGYLIVFPFELRGAIFWWGIRAESVRLVAVLRVKSEISLLTCTQQVCNIFARTRGKVISKMKTLDCPVE